MESEKRREMVGKNNDQSVLKQIQRQKRCFQQIREDEAEWK